jgi:hypothetical protein
VQQGQQEQHLRRRRTNACARLSPTLQQQPLVRCGGSLSVHTGVRNLCSQALVSLDLKSRELEGGLLMNLQGRVCG